jgi:hypothetical protein
MTSCIANLDPERYQSSTLHDLKRDWPQTNCYTDLWIELLHALGFDPAAALSFTVAQDFEGDHFTFFKFPPEDLQALFGLSISELAIYDSVEAQVVEQARRGRLTLVEADSFFLPDTRGVSYRTEHTKSTIAINAIDPATRRLDYFHGAGFYSLSGDDYDGALAQSPAQRAANPLFPYVEFVKLGCLLAETRLKATAIDLLRKHLARRPPENPVRAFKSAFRRQAEQVAGREPDFFHRYAFNTLRQIGANFELLASHLAWLDAEGEPGLAEAMAESRRLSSEAKVVQFQLARAVMRKNFDGIENRLDGMISAYDAAIGTLVQHFPAEPR